MILIGIEEHFPTAEIREAWNALGLDAVDPSVTFHLGPIEGRLLDLAKAAAADADISAKPGNREAVREMLVPRIVKPRNMA
jgi:hypothetical protein